jgi:hypothetical protein
MIKSTIIALLGLTFLVGCQRHPIEALVLGDKAFKAISDAKKVKDPWPAHEQLATAYRAIDELAECEIGLHGDYCKYKIPDPAINAMDSELDRYALQAVKKGDPKAIAAVFELESADRLAVYAPYIFEAADRAGSTPQDGVVLRVAGRMVARGDVAERDNKRAVHYLERAWRAGEVQAANDIALQFQAAKDISTAYYWSLLCIEPCKRETKVALNDLQLELTTDAILQAQLAASGVSTVNKP